MRAAASADGAAERADPAGSSSGRGADDDFGSACVGYVFSEKKRGSLLTPQFVDRAGSVGLRFVPVDPNVAIHEQAGHPYDVILHKLPASSPHIKDWETRLAAYERANPAVCIVDTPQAARQLSNRATMLQAVKGIDLGDGIGTEVAAPRQLVVQGDAAAVAAAVRESGLAFPLLAKPLMADGSELSHALALVHDAAGVARLARGDVPGLRLPCVLQEFVDHGGSLFKVYVVGDAVTTTRRRSLPNQRGAITTPRAEGLQVVERISTLGVHRREQQQLLLAQQQQRGGAQLDAAAAAAAGSSGVSAFASSPPGYHIEGAAAVLEPSAAFVAALARALKASLGLQLFNFDLIRVAGARDRFLVVDINYFPGIAKMPGYEAVFADFLRQSVEKRRAAVRSLAGAEEERGDGEPPAPDDAAAQRHAAPRGAPQPGVSPPLCACGSD